MTISPSQRPAVWVGHVVMMARDVPASREFLVKLGMRPLEHADGFAILELRGGTHLVLLASEEASPGPAPFDLMVEDLDATHVHFVEQGLEPSVIQSGEIHRSFNVVDPSGHEITFNSTHVSDQPV